MLKCHCFTIFVLIFSKLIKEIAVSSNEVKFLFNILSPYLVSDVIAGRKDEANIDENNEIYPHNF